MGLNSREFIVTLTRHLSLGWMLIPYWAKRKSDEVVEIEELADASMLLTERLTEAEKSIVRIVDCYTDKKLMNIYSKEKYTADFFRKMTEKKLKEIIRPYIEKKQLEIIELLRQNAIPLYLKDAGQKELFTHNSLFLYENDAHVVFNFQITENHFRYNINCTQNNKEFSLLNKTPIILVNKPACFLQGRSLYVFKQIEVTRLTPFFNRLSIEVPVTFTKKYMESIVLPTIEQFDVNSAGFNIIEDDIKPIAELTIEESILGNPAFSLRFNYHQMNFISGSVVKYKYAYLVEKDGTMEVHTFKRNTQWENERCAILLNLGLKRISDASFSLPSTDILLMFLDWVKENRKAIEADFTLISSSVTDTYFIGDILLQRDVVTASDWFDIKITVKIGNYQIPFVRFKKHIMRGIREYLLPDSTIALLPVEWFTEYKEFFSFGTEKEDSIRLKKVHYKLLQEWWNESGEKRGDIEKLLQSYNSLPHIDVPSSIKATLRLYQQEGFSWMVHLAENGFGGCLADDMGLGKTLQTITLLQHLYQKGQPEILTEFIFPEKTMKADKAGQLSLFADDMEEKTEKVSVSLPLSREMLSASLVVLPTSLLHNWMREIKKFSNLTVYEYSSSNRTRSRDIAQIFRHYNIILTTYGVLRNDIEYLQNYSFEYVVLDESQYIKNPDSLIYRTVLALKSKHRLALTGTPIENSLKDLWAQFNFINPGLLGSAESFRNNFIVPITKEGNTRMESRLQRLIQPFFLRRTKDQVAPELPPLTEEVLYCEMTARQNEAYKKEKNMLRNTLLAASESESKHTNTFMALQGITRLRLLANHPQMVYPNFNEVSGKMEQIMQYYEQIMQSGHKVLIFSSFVKYLKLLATAFDKEGWKYAMLTGQTLNREDEIRRFSDDKTISCFFISLKAGGVGLNLTEADYVFIIDPWWNPAAEMQAVSRAHRIGQDKQVIVYRFITSDTIEEKISKLQEDKSLLAQTFITNNNPLLGLSNQDLEALFE